MVSGDKAFVRAYDAQAAVDHRSQVIIGGRSAAGEQRQEQFVPMAEQVCEDPEDTPLILSADARYWTEAAS